MNYDCGDSWSGECGGDEPDPPKLPPIKETLKEKIMKKILALLVALGLSACAMIGEKAQVIVGNDLARTSELAAKYGKPEVQKCADFLTASLGSEDSKLAQLDALLKEDTSGLLSRALKATLVAELVKSLQDPAAQAQFKKDFDTNCAAVAGQIVIDIARDSRKIGQKRIGL